MKGIVRHPEVLEQIQRKTIEVSSISSKEPLKLNIVCKMLLMQ